MFEVLGRSIKAALDQGTLKGLSFHLNQPPLTHNHFVDDTMLMGMPTIKEAKLGFQQMLNDFEVALGTLVNRLKY
jgi:hypothetical protein